MVVMSKSGPASDCSLDASDPSSNTSKGIEKLSFRELYPVAASKVEEVISTLSDVSQGRASELYFLRYLHILYFLFHQESPWM